MRIWDSLVNLVSMMGTERDKAAHSVYGDAMLSDQELVAAYRGAWLPRKIVDIPALDSCREWRDWQAEQDEIEAIEETEKRLNLQGKIYEARTQARLFGGAALFIGTGDTDLSSELRPESIRKDGLRYVTVLNRRQLTVTEIERDPLSEWYGKPRAYTVSGVTSGQVTIHPSRLVVLRGNECPDPELAVSQSLGWGDSVLLSVMRAIKNADGTADNIASLVFEAKVDVISVPNLMRHIADPDYKSRLVERFALANQAKGINGALLLDAEESYEQKSATFTGLPDVLDRTLQIVSGAADIPVTRLLGQSPAGMNATGESDLRNYYDRIRSTQSLEMEPAMRRLDEAVIRSALGDRPKEIHYVWGSLWQISDKERAEIGKMNAESASILAATSLIPAEALAKSVVNQAVEMSIYPGLDQAVDDAGGLPDYAMEAEVERQAAAEARAAFEQGQQQGDAAPRTLYVKRNVLNGDEIVAWARGQGFETTLDPSDMHVTIAFSRATVDWMKVGEPWEAEMKIGAGGPRLVEPLGGKGAVVLLFASRELEWRHRSMIESGASWDWPEYQPHVSITYDGTAIDLEAVEPFRGEIRLGPEIFEEVDEDWTSKVSET